MWNVKVCNIYLFCGISTGKKKKTRRTKQSKKSYVMNCSNCSWKWNFPCAFGHSWTIKWSCWKVSYKCNKKKKKKNLLHVLCNTKRNRSWSRNSQNTKFSGNFAWSWFVKFMFDSICVLFFSVQMWMVSASRTWGYAVTLRRATAFPGTPTSTAIYSVPPMTM